MKTAVQWLVEQISYTTTSSEIISYHKDISKLVEQAKKMEKEQKLKYQLFIGKVIEIIGDKKTIELLKECHETFKSE
jgi:hypothetical protein